jgi:hypothetical protein
MSNLGKNKHKLISDHLGSHKQLDNKQQLKKKSRSNRSFLHFGSFL